MSSLQISLLSHCLVSVKFFSLRDNNSAAGGTRGSREGAGVAARGGQFRGKTVSAPFC